jgi:PAS domain-containing protein
VDSSQFRSQYNHTDSKKIVIGLDRSEKKFQSICEITSDWIWEVNEDGIYAYSNPKVKDILGYAPN